jgi:hypothetical protein
VEPETAAEKRRFEQALIRRNHRLALVDELKKSQGGAG